MDQKRVFYKGVFMFAGQNNKRNVRFIRPPNLIKQKVGSGGLEADKLNAAEALIGESGHLFIPFAKDMLTLLKQLIDVFETRKDEGNDYIEDIIHPIMDIKANGAMLGYPMTSHIADVTLHFLETIDALNVDSIKIIDVTHKALSVVVQQDMKGFDNKISNELRKELNQACDRYIEKHGLGPSPDHVNLNQEIGE